MIEVFCPYCNKKAELVNGDIIYPHRTDLFDLTFYNCNDCRAYVGTHKGTLKPFGTLANAVLRRTRHQTHVVFDGFWQRNKIRRQHAYGQLAKAMNIDVDQCHIGMFDVDQCQQVQSIVKSWARHE